MARYTRLTRVEAPLSEVWAFHLSPDSLVAASPRFVHLRVERAEGPDGDPNPDELDVGAKVHVSVRPLGVGPRLSWTSHVVERERDDGSARFRDVMSNGPFPVWEHTHRFVADGDATILEDVVKYELPGGPLGRAVSPLGNVGMAPLFRYRHRKTKELLE